MSDPVIDHLTAHGFLRTRKIMLNNFLGGLAWGFGSVIGATLFVIILISVLRIFNFIPGVNDFADQISGSFHKTPVLDQTAK